MPKTHDAEAERHQETGQKMIKERPNKTLFIIAAGTMVVLAALASFLYVRGVFSLSPVPRTSQGILLEGLIPKDVPFVVSFNPTDKAERQRFAKIWETILQDRAGTVLPFVLSDILKLNSDAQSLGELAAVIGKDFRVLVAYGPQYFSQPMLSEIYVLASTDNPSLVRSMMDKVKESNRQIKISRDTENSLVMNNDKTYFGLLGDAIFYTNAGEQNAKNLLSRFDRRLLTKLEGNSLAEQPHFRQMFRQLKKPFSGYFLMNNVNQNKTLPSIMRYSAGIFRAQKNGLGVESLTAGRDAKESEFGSTFAPFNLSLYKEIPAQNLMFFSVSHNIGDTISAAIPDKKAWDQIKLLTGLDFQTDIAPVWNRESVFEIQDSGAILPAVSFYIDGGGAPEKAFQLVKKLNDGFAVWIGLANMSLQAKEDSPILEKNNFKSIATGGIVKIYLNRIPKEVADIPLFADFKEPVEFSYGILPPNILFLSLQPNFEKNIEENKVIQGNPLLQQALNLNANPSGLLMIDAQAIGRYAKRIADFTGSQSPFDIIAKYLAPIKSFFEVSSGDGTNVYGKGLLEITQN